MIKDKLELAGLKFKAGKVVITGEGSIELTEKKNMDMEIIVNLPKRIVSRLGGDIRALLSPSDMGDEYKAFSIRVYGSSDHLRTDLLSRLASRALGNLTKKEKKDRSHSDKWEKMGLQLLDQLLKKQ